VGSLELGPGAGKGCLKSPMDCPHFQARAYAALPSMGVRLSEG